MHNALILICAAGKSSRFAGGDKLLARIGDHSMLRHVCLAACATPARAWVALPGADHPRANEFADLKAQPKVFAGSSEGLSGTLRDAVSALPRDVDYLIICLADQPWLRPSHITQLWDARHQPPQARAWRLADANSTPGHPVMVHRDLFPLFADLYGDSGAKPVLATPQAQTQLIQAPTAQPRLDIDTKESLDAYLETSEKREKVKNAKHK